MVFQSLSVFFLLSMLSGCYSSWVTPKLIVHLQGQAHMNAYGWDKAHPLRVQLLQSDQEGLLQSVTLQKVQEARIEGLLAPAQEYYLMPLESKRWTVRLHPETRYIAVVGLFREPHGLWKKVLPYKPNIWGVHRIHCDAGSHAWENMRRQEKGTATIGMEGF